MIAEKHNADIQTGEFLLDIWSGDYKTINRQLAKIGDLDLAFSLYQLACRKYPDEPISLREGNRIIRARRTDLK